MMINAFLCLNIIFGGTYEGRRKKDTDDSNIFRFFCDGKKANYNTAGTNITQTEVEGENPFGTTSKLLKVTRAANVSSNGRITPYNKTVKIDSSYTYRYACYVKKTNNKFLNYFGFRGYEKVSETVYNSAIRALNGNESTSAYHVSSTNFGTLNRWYLVIGYVTGKDISSAPAGSGVYDMVTKKKTSATVTNYRFKDITRAAHSGTLIEYSASAQTPTEEDTTYIYDIRFDKMDGTEPSLHELLYGTETPTVESTSYQYAQSSSNTTQPTSWSDTVPTATADYYMWTKTTVTYTDGTTSTTYSVSKNGATGPRGTTGNYTIRVPLYYVSTSTAAPAKPTDQIIATAAATTTTWTKGKYTSYAVGKYYYTCEQTETYNASGTYLSSAWSTPARDIEYENASTAKLRASGKYIGKKGATFTGYTASSNWDWFLATASFSLSGLSGNTVAGNVYIWNGASWTKDTDTSHLAASMNDMMALVDTITADTTSVGAFASVFAKTLATQQAFINQLFVNQIKLMTQGQNVGAIYGGKYLADGTVDPNATTDKGAYMDALGEFKASNGQFSGNIQSENYFDAEGFTTYSNIRYNLTCQKKTGTGVIEQYTDKDYNFISTYINDSTYNIIVCDCIIKDSSNNTIVSYNIGVSVPANHKIYASDTNETPEDSDYEGFAAVQLPDKNFIWLKVSYNNADGTLYKLTKKESAGYKLDENGNAKFIGAVIEASDFKLKTHAGDNIQLSYKIGEISNGSYLYELKPFGEGKLRLKFTIGDNVSYFGGQITINNEVISLSDQELNIQRDVSYKTNETIKIILSGIAGGVVSFGFILDSLDICLATDSSMFKSFTNFNLINYQMFLSR